MTEKEIDKKIIEIVTDATMPIVKSFNLNIEETEYLVGMIFSILAELGERKMYGNIKRTNVSSN